MVIAAAQPRSPADTTIKTQAGQAFAARTAESLASGDDDYARAGLTLYKGATIDDPVDGMYSFVPALPVTGQYPRFALPPVPIPGLMTPASTQSAHGVNRHLPTREGR